MDIAQKTLLILSLIFLISESVVYSLECYVCDEQEDNNGKCASTVMPCRYDEDRCISVVKWGSTPYWEIGAPMQYYISKMCATKTQCEAKHNETIVLCQRIEWRDWQCSECCQGDRCNYYITLSGTCLTASFPLMFLSGCFLWMFLSQ